MKTGIHDDVDPHFPVRAHDVNMSVLLESSRIFWVFTLDSWTVYRYCVQLPASRWGQIRHSSDLVGLSKSIAWAVLTLLRVSFNRVMQAYRVLRLSLARIVNWEHRLVQTPVHSSTNQNEVFTPPPPSRGTKPATPYSRPYRQEAGDPSCQPLVRIGKGPWDQLTRPEPSEVRSGTSPNRSRRQTIRALTRLSLQSVSSLFY